MKTKIKIIPLFIFFVLASSCNNPAETIDLSIAESHIISATQAHAMKTEYENTITPLIKNLKSKDSVEYQPTQFAYIDLETLKSYVALLEEVNNKNQEKVSGVRVYMSAYPNKTDKKGRYPGRETIFFAPTFKVTGNELSRTYTNLENVPFTIKPVGDDKYAGKFEIATELLNEFDNKPSMTTKSNENRTDGNTSLFMNDLQLTPPPK